MAKIDLVWFGSQLIFLSSSQTYKEMKVQHAVPHSSQMLAQQKFLTIPVL